MKLLPSPLYNIPENILYDISIHSLPPQESLKLFYVCKRWSKIVDSKLFWTRIAKHLAQSLMLPEEQLLPDNTLDLCSYKLQIRKNTEQELKAIQEILIRIFPGVQTVYGTKMIDPLFFDPYLEFIRKREIDFCFYFRSYWNIDDLTEVCGESEAKKFLTQEQIPPRVLALFIQAISDIFTEKPIENSISVDTTFKYWLRDAIINKHNIQGLLSWLHLARLKLHALFSYSTYKIAYRYVHCYTSKTLRQNLFEKNEDIYQLLVGFLQKIAKDPAFLQIVSSIHNKLYVKQTNTQEDSTIMDVSHLTTLLSKATISDTV